MRLYPHGNGVFKPHPPAHRLPSRFGRAPYVARDISPYPSMLESHPDGTPVMVTSRSQHREMLRRHGCEEVGTERPGWMKEKQYLEESGMPEAEAARVIQASEREKRWAGVDPAGISFEFQEPDAALLNGGA